MTVDWGLIGSLIAAGSIGIWIACLLLLRKAKRPYLQPADKKVAVLLAARDEEENLEACLAHLLDQDYPKHLVKIFLGDDQSTDQTLPIAKALAEKYPGRLQVMAVRERIGNARGKANVLAQLAKEAEAWADYFCITDADIRVPHSWISTLVHHADANTGTLSAATVVEASGIWSKLQRADWLLALAMAKAYTHFPFIGRPVTAIGNNMLVPVAAYRKTGGYEQIPFSITEDLELMQQAKQLGYTNHMLAEAGSCAVSTPAPDLMSLLHQRKRWMTGAMQLPWLMVALLLLQAFFYPAILLALWFAGWEALGIWAVKVLLQAWLINRFAGMLRERALPVAFLLMHELYSFVLSSCLLVFYVLPIPIRWKGRYYKDNAHEIR